jgi:hypothetical protein
MKITEIMEDASASTTSAGSMAVVEQPLGMLSRNSGSLYYGKYSTAPKIGQKPETRNIDRARRQFKNSPGN